jgi:hypothetical protein
VGEDRAERAMVERRSSRWRSMLSMGVEVAGEEREWVSDG